MHIENLAAGRLIGSYIKINKQMVCFLGAGMVYNYPPREAMWLAVVGL